MDNFTLTKEKSIVLGILIFMLCFAIALVTYSVGNDQGQSIGFEDGYSEGNQNGFLTGTKFGDSIGFNRGFSSKYSDLMRLDSLIKAIENEFLPNVNYVTIVNSVAKVGEYNSSYYQYRDFMNAINEKLILFLATELEISDEQKQEILAHYRGTSESINKENYELLFDLNRRTTNNTEQTFFSTRYLDNINNLDQVFSKSFCHVTSLLTAGVVKAPINSGLIKTGTAELCKSIAGPLSQKFVQELKRQALIMDYEVSQNTIKSQISDLIFDLGTSFVKQSGYYEYDYSVTLFQGTWLETTSNADLDVNATSITKAGFKLVNSFEMKIDHYTKSIILNFPEPEVLSHEMSYSWENVDEGWAVDVTKDKINQVLSETRRKLLSKALETNLLDDAKNHAEDLVRVVFTPLAQSYRYPYTVILNIGDDERIILDYRDLDYESILL